MKQSLKTGNIVQLSRANTFLGYGGFIIFILFCLSCNSENTGTDSESSRLLILGILGLVVVGSLLFFGSDSKSKPQKNDPITPIDNINSTSQKTETFEKQLNNLEEKLDFLTIENEVLRKEVSDLKSNIEKHPPLQKEETLLKKDFPEDFKAHFEQHFNKSVIQNLLKKVETDVSATLEEQFSAELANGFEKKYLKMIDEQLSELINEDKIAILMDSAISPIKIKIERDFQRKQKDNDKIITRAVRQISDKVKDEVSERIVFDYVQEQFLLLEHSLLDRMNYELSKSLYQIQSTPFDKNFNLDKLKTNYKHKILRTLREVYLTENANEILYSKGPNTDNVFLRRGLIEEMDSDSLYKIIIKNDQEAIYSLAENPVAISKAFNETNVKDKILEAVEIDGVGRIPSNFDYIEISYGLLMKDGNHWKIKDGGKAKLKY